MLREASTFAARVVLLGLLAVFALLVYERQPARDWRGVAEALETLNSRQPARGQ